jgi:uncharacterized RDD family membrane protein YckC
VSARRRRVVTPEGIPLEIELARAGDRMGAFLLDFIIQLVATVGILILAAWASAWDSSWTLAAGLLVSFLVRTFYFTWFEIRWQGRTPGKRAVGARVMDADGGPLRSDAIVVRNLMRELEVWTPLVFLLAPDTMWPDAPGWAKVAFSVWAFVFLLLPLFNRDRLRAGDIVAGTIVVLAPRALLLRDLGATSRESSFEFADEQLAVYGIYELQVLEDLLRRSDGGRREAFRAVCAQIRKKIAWQGGDVDPERFLREFYAALRGRLESRMLLGKRKKDKFADA